MSIKLSYKLSLGFASLLILTSALGGIAVFKMDRAAADSRNLSDDVVPDAKYAALLKSTNADLMLATRSFGLSGQKSYLDIATTKFADLVEVLHQPEKDVALENLKSDVVPAITAEQAYNKLFGETVDAQKEHADALEQMTISAGVFDDSIKKVVQAQSDKIGQLRETSGQPGSSNAQTDAEVTRRQKLSDAASSAQDDLNSIRILALKSLATNAPKLLDDAQTRLVALGDSLDKIAASASQEDAVAIAACKNGFNAYRGNVVRLADSGKKLSELAPRRTEAANALNKVIDEISLVSLKNTVDISKGTTVSLSAASRTVLVGLGITAGLGIVLAFLITRSITKPINRIIESLNAGAAQTSSAAQQVSGSSQSLAQGASEQAASLEETSSSLEEMSSMTKKNADTARQASLLSAEAKTSADKGNQAMGKMSDAIDSIQKASTETAKIVKTIDEIAFQTNLLALNAAVEAARAGEAGKGFAVVAEEVRNLAMRSAEAAKTTSSLIEGSVASSKNGVTIAQDVAKTLSEIQGAVEKVNGLISEIAAAGQEQSTGIDQVNQAVQQMDKVTQSNAAASEESAAAAEELSSQSEQLRTLVGELTGLVVGKGDQASPPQDRATRRFPHQPAAGANKAPHSPGEKARAEKAIPLGPVGADFGDFTVNG